MDNRLVGTGISLAASTYLFTHSTCLNKKKIAGAGVIFYSVLLLGILYKAEWVTTAIKSAIATHSVLIIKMIQDNSICPGCLMAASGNLYSLLTSPVGESPLGAAPSGWA